MGARGETATGGLDLHGRIDRLLDFRPPATRRMEMGGKLVQPFPPPYAFLTFEKESKDSTLLKDMGLSKIT